MGGAVFPQWLDRARPLAAVLLILVPTYLVAMAYYGGSPRTIDVGYSPKQPVPYSHALHVGQLGLDCRYCHNTVDKAAHAAVPPTATCMNCHATIGVDRPRLLAVRESSATGKPIPWVRVHNLPDFVYFDHSAHVNKGVSCVSCHGRIDTMDQVTQVTTLRMGWCLDCHRNPEPNLRPKQFVTKLDWVSDEDPAALGKRLRKEYNVQPSTDCSTCHR